MPLTHFSALENIKKLHEVNFTDTQAETVVELIEQQVQIIQERGKELNHLKNKELTPKENLKETELLLQKDIKEVELRLQKEIAIVNNNLLQQKNELIKWVLGSGIETILAIAGLLKVMIY